MINTPQPSAFFFYFGKKFHSHNNADGDILTEQQDHEKLVKPEATNLKPSVCLSVCPESCQLVDKLFIIHTLLIGDESVKSCMFVSCSLLRCFQGLFEKLWIVGFLERSLIITGSQWLVQQPSKYLENLENKNDSRPGSSVQGFNRSITFTI